MQPARRYSIISVTLAMLAVAGLLLILSAQPASASNHYQTTDTPTPTPTITPTYPMTFYLSEYVAVSITILKPADVWYGQPWDLNMDIPPTATLVGLIWEGDRGSGSIIRRQGSMWGTSPPNQMWNTTSGSWDGWRCGAESYIHDNVEYDWIDICAQFGYTETYVNAHRLSLLPSAGYSDFGDDLDAQGGWNCYGNPSLEFECSLDHVRMILYGVPPDEPQPPAEPSCTTYLLDADFEGYPPDMSIWYPLQPYAGYGRVDHLSNGWDAVCDNYSQEEGGEYLDQLYSEVAQNFTWPGGDMWVKFTIACIAPVDLMCDYQVYLIGDHQAWVVDDGDIATFLTNAYQYELADIPAGSYTLQLRGGSKSEMYNEQVYYDAVQVSSCELSIWPDMCNIEPPATPTQTPTGTLLPSPTPTPSGTPYPETGNLIRNCDFEYNYDNGLQPFPPAFWTPLNREEKNYTTEPGGPIGTHYAIEGTDLDGNIVGFRQQFSWLADDYGPNLWINYYSVGDSFLSILNTDMTTFAQQRLSTTEWGQHEFNILNMPTGTYYLELSVKPSLSKFYAAGYDGIAIGNHDDVGCSVSGHDETPTPGPTQTAVNTRTPVPTATAAQPPTNTPRPPTITPTGTQNSPTPTETYAPGTPTPTVVVTIPPPPQQNLGCGYPCVRPIWPEFNINLLVYIGSLVDYIGWWIEYVFCGVWQYFAWCPDNTTSVVGWLDSFNQFEPFGTINELRLAFESVRTQITSFSWSSGPCPSAEGPNLSMFLEPDIPAIEDIDWFGNTGETHSFECTLPLSGILPAPMATGFCYSVNLMCDTGFMPWIQFFVDVGALILLGIYIYRYKNDLAI